jgi:hypothetical protein
MYLRSSDLRPFGFAFDVGSAVDVEFRPRNVNQAAPRPIPSGLPYRFT